jgi:hypothetical protein
MPGEEVGKEGAKREDGTQSVPEPDTAYAWLQVVGGFFSMWNAW